MIASIWITIWTTFTGWAVSLLPAYHLPPKFWSTFHMFMIKISVWSVVLPIEQLFTAIGIIIAFELTVVALRLVIGLVALIRGSGYPQI